MLPECYVAMVCSKTGHMALPFKKEATIRHNSLKHEQSINPGTKKTQAWEQRDRGLSQDRVALDIRPEYSYLASLLQLRFS